MAIDGGVLSGPSWTLRVPEGWREFNAAALEVAHPDFLRWAIEPGSTAQLSVRCGPGFSGQGAQLGAALGSLTGAPAKAEPITGPWLAGFIARGQTVVTPPTHHVLALYELGGTACEVHAWGPAPVIDGVALDALVQRFQGAGARAFELARSITRHVETTPALAAALDAGVPLAGLAARGLPRLDAAQLDERFRLRQRLLESIDVEACARLVLHDDPGAWLELLTDDEVRAWTRLTIAALDAATRPGPSGFDPHRARALEERLAAEQPAFAQAREVMAAAERATPAVLCAAELQRLETAFGLPQEERRQLLQEWLGADP